MTIPGELRRSTPRDVSLTALAGELLRHGARMWR
jgi:hypothetical protein